ncbi:ComEC/Rec2 family competence protein, partial [Patescibacteria group bacterium]
MLHKLFYIFTIGFVVGIAFRSFFNFGWSFSLFIIGLGVILYSLGTRSSKFLAVAVLFVAAGLGMLRFDFADISSEYLTLDEKVGQEILIEGIIIDEPDERENNARIIIEPIVSDQSELFGLLETRYSKILVTVDQYPEWEYGDSVRIEGKLQVPKNFETDSGRVFNYVDYLGKDGIRYQMFNPKIELLGKGDGNFIKEKLFAFKRAFLENSAQIIPEPHTSLLGGLVVGAKQALGKDLLDDFRATGIIHIVVLSGYNVTIVAEAIMRFLSFAPRVFAMSFGAISIICFAIMTGAGATIVRASIMALLVIAARATGRTKEITTALLFAGLLMLLHNPKILIFDPSFQLSFLATLGLIYLAPLIEKHFHLLPTKWGFREFATATVATQIFVLPLLIFMIGEVSLVSLPVNLFVLAVIPLTMLFGFLAGMAAFISFALAAPFAFFAYILLAYELKVVDLFASLP